MRNNFLLKLFSLEPPSSLLVVFYMELTVYVIWFR